MRQKAMGKAGLTAIIVLSAAFCVISYLFLPSYIDDGKFGICLPSPNNWNLLPAASMIIDVVLIFGCTAGISLVNRFYSFVKSTDYVLPAVFLLLTASNPILDSSLNTSVMMVAACIVCLAVMFETYRRSNASVEVFVVATVISIGSMFQYAFLSLVPAFIGVAAVMKCLHFREVVAFVLGLIAPYWVAVGLGFIPLSSFSVPAFSNLFNNLIGKTDIFLLLLNIGIVSLVSVLLSLNNGVRLYAGNSRIRAMNNAVNILMVVAIVCMIFDYNNFLSYFATIYLGAAVQLSNLFALFKIRKGWISMLMLALLLTAFYVAMFVNLF